MILNPSRHAVFLLFKKLFILTPVGIIIIFLLFLLTYSGEIADIKQVAHLQINAFRPILLGLAYRNVDKYYKATATLSRNPDILVLGSSRVLGFRSCFFKKGTKYYNAGCAVDRVRDYREFINYILAAKIKPKIIIIGLDQYFFNTDYISSESGDGDESYSPNKIGLSFIQTGIGKEIEDYLKGKYRLHQLFRKSALKKIGFNALVKEAGFLNDGSYFYGGVISDPVYGHDYQFKDTLQRIQAGNRRFQYAKEVSEKNIPELEKFLNLCKAQNIYVIGFLPPFAHSICARMKSMGDKYAYLSKLHERLQPVFLNNGFQLYDFTDLASVGASDDEVIDGFHGSEKAYLRLFLKLIENEPVLRDDTDIFYLQRRLSESTNPYCVFSNTEF